MLKNILQKQIEFNFLEREDKYERSENICTISKYLDFGGACLKLYNFHFAHTKEKKIGKDVQLN